MKMGKESIWRLAACAGLAFAALSDSASGEVVSEEGLKDRLIELNGQGKFDEASALLLEYIREEPDAGYLIVDYVYDLSQVRDQFDKAILFVDRIMPVMKNVSPTFTGRILKERAIAILFGRYADTRNPEALSRARGDLIAGLKLNPRMSEAYLHLAVVCAIQGDVEESKAAFRKAHDTCAEPRHAASLLDDIAYAERDPKGFCKSFQSFYRPQR